jgi:hypothetical protein
VVVFAQADNLAGFRVVHGKRFLRQNAFQMAPVAHRLPHDAELLVRWHSDVEDLNGGISQQLLERAIKAGNSA